MSFWSGELLKRRLGEVILSPAPNERHVDCNAYKLCVGKEVFITPHGGSKDPERNRKKTLKDGEQFSIPAGQFAFVLTEEEVYVPKDVMAFISISSSRKFGGLVN